MKRDIGINEDQLKSVAIELNNLLVDEIVLYMQTRNYYWNIEDPNFNEMHLF